MVATPTAMTDPETPASAIDRGRQAYDRRAWAETFDQLSAADLAGPLELEDLERLTIAAHMLGRDDDGIALLTRAHQEAVRLGDVSRAARTAFWLTMEHLGKGEFARAGGWLARGERVMGSGHEDRVEQGYLLVAVASRTQEEGDPSAALESYDRVGRIAERFDDRDLATLARLGGGQALIALGETALGVTRLDEAMVAVTAGEVSPVIVGIVYCSVIEACQQIFDLRRAHEWTAALDRWCESQPELVRYRGQCLLYRAELKQFHGDWQDADDEAQRARDRLGPPATEPAVGQTYYLQAELRRLRGEFAHAETAYRDSSRSGRRPEPGLALLRLAQGRLDSATAAIRRATDETQDALNRPRLLEAYVQIMLGVGAVSTARVAVDELARLARAIDAPLLVAMADQAEGAVLLGEGDRRASLVSLRRALAGWQALEAPYEAARVRVLIGIACRELGDEDAAALELDAAAAVFRQLGAAPDLARVTAITSGARSAGGLTDRELEVLRLVAAGQTNRAIAAELGISEKTVARHLSNIFAKLGLSSRAAATAYAYEHDLLSSPA